MLPDQCDASDTDALRFLWWPDRIGDLPEDYEMLAHIFGAESSPFCANKALNKTAQDNEDNCPQEFVKTSCRNLSIVDVVFRSVPSAHPAVRLTAELTMLLKEGGVRLTIATVARCYSLSHQI